MVAEPAADEEEEDEDDDDDDEGAAEDEYRVERILKHDFDGSTTIYQIKWLGWNKASDLTWEPVENLDGAQDILAAYHKKIGGAPDPPAAKSSYKKGKGGGKRSASDAFDASPASQNKKKSSDRKSNGASAVDAKARVMPLGSWDDLVLRVTSIVEEVALVKGSGGKKGEEERELVGLLEWKKEGQKTQHKMRTLRQKVPQRLLDYYEQHLVFTSAENDGHAPKDKGDKTDANADEDVEEDEDASME
ncbi:hypothetical protein LTR35_004316 [Friedmanniomyces endolithicus]|uniref:Chromo domain-containing protein n=1 Tax=Friedmanniomyces endolithicus TaxID=329885 RepID=A0AAN6JED5_9PEZI|nr:hypothetical protein LTS00_013713 [Friedmanniomyces endolithicus]KAK0286847.1 hypothetical protein LTR35_004316 [Friedmanniomyces endolithicus]KAK0326595.1 hypothetical protein LTR82_002437 [Friedmanniomyces endolithicus]KAK1017547.1 hypothetical protein LTR54_002205 [Friedmanniomyces endolithicus]